MASLLYFSPLLPLYLESYATAIRQFACAIRIIIDTKETTTELDSLLPSLFTSITKNEGYFVDSLYAPPLHGSAVNAPLVARARGIGVASLVSATRRARAQKPSHKTSELS